MVYLDIAEYGLLLLLALRNAWAILVKQGEYKNIPILMFYVFSLLAIFIRLVVLIWDYTPSLFKFNAGLLQQPAKICVGVVQDWITLELTIRIRNSKGYIDIEEAVKKKLRFFRRLLFSVITLAFTAYLINIIISATRPENYGYAFPKKQC